MTAERTRKPKLNETPGSRDPEDRRVRDARERHEKTLDKTIADSFPTSDPPSTIPDPDEDEGTSER